MEHSAFELLQGMEKSWWYRGRSAAVRSALVRELRPPGQAVLDFGAGFGGMHSLLQKFGQHVAAFEPQEDAARSANARGYAAVYSTRAEALRHQYDLIGAFDVMEHVEDDERFLRDAHAALTRGGYLVLTVPAFQFLWSMHDVEHQHFRRYTRPELQSLLSDAGFEMRFASYWNMTLFLPAVLMRLLGRTGDSALALPRAIDALLYMVVKIESFMVRLFPLPFGTGIVIVARKKEKKPLLEPVPSDLVPIEAVVKA